jgi:acetyltransferase-like isoleucine patch superfamily enzyme
MARPAPSDTFPALSRQIDLGAGSQIDPTAILGYPTGRKITSQVLRIGEGAVVRSNSVIYAGSRIGSSLQTGHNVVIREENEIGDHFQIWNNSVVDYGCKIGNNVKLHCNIYVAQFTEIADDVFMAPGVTIANDPHPGCPDSGRCMRGPRIERGVQIGVNVTILPFVTIGERALIGSGTVVTKDVPPETVFFGNPGRPGRSIYDLTCLVDNLRDRPYDPA